MHVTEHLFDDELLIENGTSALHQLNRMAAPRLRDAPYDGDEFWGDIPIRSACRTE
jgi:hypothetical protein